MPKGGETIWFVQQRWIISLLIGAAAMFLLWPADDEDELTNDNVADDSTG